MNIIKPSRTVQSFHPPKRILMGPGPTEIHPRVLTTMAQPAIGYLDPRFVDMMEELKDLLRYVFQTTNPLTFPLSGPGSVGMEFCFVNLVEPGDKVIVCRNGVFGGRMVENVERAGGTPIILDFEWGTAVDANVVEAAFKNHPDAKILAFVHAETSTGVCSDAKTLAEIAHRYNAVTIVDTVTSLAGIPVLVDEWQLDAVYSASQKCLSCTPGLSPVTINDRALNKMKARKDKVHSWFMDINLLTGYWQQGTRTYHHTAPTNSLFALHEALVLIQEEGIENTWARHKKYHDELKAGIYQLGLNMFVKDEFQLPQMNAIVVPNIIDDLPTRQKLLAEYNLEIGAGLGPLAGKIWRIGIMGYSARAENIMMCLTALKKVL